MDAKSIHDTYEERRKRNQLLTARMDEVRTIYNGDWTVDLPGLDAQSQPPVPNLLAQGVDQMAGRISSTTPTITVIPETTNRPAERRAQTASRVYGGWWAADRLPLKLNQRARDLTAYGVTTTSIVWDKTQDRPTWQVRDPLTTYPSPEVTIDQQIPRNVIYAYHRSKGWLKRNNYPHPTGQDFHDDHMVLVLEYVDDTQRVLTCHWVEGWDRKEHRVLHNHTHEYGITPATVTPRAGLDRLSGQFDQMISMYKAQAKLMALEIVAVEKGVFPDTYLVSRPGEIARFVDGPYDGRTGKIGVIAGGDLTQEQSSPGYLTNPTIDRLERNQRVTGGIPAEFSGESGTNIRTGRRGDAVLSATIDMPIAYAQQLLSTALEYENQIAATMSRKHQGGKTNTLRTSLAGSDKPVKYDPNVVFTSVDNSVAYPAAGADINTLIVGLGQRVGLGTMSKKTAATLDPYVDNPEVEHDRIIGEGLEQSLLAGIQQQAASGQIPPLVLAKIKRLVETDKLELAEAMVKVAEDAAKEQEAAAAEQQQQAPTAEQMMAGPAAASMTGNPDAGSPIPGLGNGMSDLTQMLGSLRMPTQGMAPSVGVEGRV